MKRFIPILLILITLTISVVAYPVYEPQPKLREFKPFDKAETIEPIEAIQEPIDDVQAMSLWGNARVTAFCSCGSCCGKWANYRKIDKETGKPIVVGSAGVPLVQGVSVASPLPNGTKIYIDGLGEYIVQDSVANWVAKKYNNYCIDVYFDSHQAAIDWVKSQGKDYYDVYIIDAN